MTMEKFTFKKQPRETGLAAVGNPNQATDIKHNGKIVGYIAGPNWMSKSSDWIVRIMVIEGLESWSWKTLKKKFEEEPDARKYLNENAARIVGFGLYHMEPD